LIIVIIPFSGHAARQSGIRNKYFMLFIIPLPQTGDPLPRSVRCQLPIILKCCMKIKRWELPPLFFSFPYTLSYPYFLHICFYNLIIHEVPNAV
jgi:hypothetical protein